MKLTTLVKEPKSENGETKDRTDEAGLKLFKAKDGKVPNNTGNHRNREKQIRVSDSLILKLMHLVFILIN